MGTKIPPPPTDFPPGQDCPACTPALFPPGGWPLYLYATFIDMVPCSGFPDPPNGYHFKLKQGDNPCTYLTTAIVADVTYDVMLDLSWSYLWLYRGTSPSGYCFSGWEISCRLQFPTSISTCPPDAAQGGSAIVQLTYARIAQLCTSHFHFLPRIGTLFEEQKVAMDHTLIRLANKTDKSCIYVYIDDEDLP